MASQAGAELTARLRLTVDAHTAPEWREAAEKAVTALTSRTDVDVEARIELMGTGTGAIVHVVLADGRSAVRRLSTPGELADSLYSVLLLPPPPAPLPETHPQIDTPAPPPPAVQRPARVALGLGASARLSFSPGYLGYGPVAYAEIGAGDWLVGAQVRWDVDDVGLASGLPDGFNMQSISIGANAGRRFVARSVEVAALLGASAAIENQEALGQGEEGPGGTYADVAASVAVRVSFPASSPYRFFSALQLDGYPRRLRGARHVDPRLPALAPWAAGVSAGVAWSSL